MNQWYKHSTAGLGSIPDKEVFCLKNIWCLCNQDISEFAVIVAVTGILTKPKSM